MYASRAFAIVSAGAMLVLGAVALLPAQQQPRAVIDPVRIMEARYEVARLWWDPARGNSLAPSKDFDDSSGQLRLQRTLLCHLSPAHERHEPFARTHPPPLG